MKPAAKALIAIMALSTLSACAIRTPAGSVVVDPNRTSVVIGDGYGGGQGTFCPPGQAKKGRC